MAASFLGWLHSSLRPGFSPGRNGAGQWRAGHHGPRSHSTGDSPQQRTAAVPGDAPDLPARGGLWPGPEGLCPGSYSSLVFGSPQHRKSLHDAPRGVGVAIAGNGTGTGRRLRRPGGGGASAPGTRAGSRPPIASGATLQYGVVATWVAFIDSSLPYGPGRARRGQSPPAAAGPRAYRRAGRGASAARLLADLVHLLLRMGDFDLPRLGLLGHGDADRQDAVGVVRLDVLGIQGVAEDQLAAEDAARPL